MFGLLSSRGVGARVASLIRLLWITMLAVHMPALLVVWRALLTGEGESVRLVGFLGLNLATLFFALKTWDVRFLRFQTDPRSLLAICVATALVHANAIGERCGYLSVPEDVPLAASVLFTAGLSRVQEALRSLSSHRRPARKVAAAPAWIVRVNVFASPRWLLTPRLCIPRAPPVRA